MKQLVVFLYLCLPWMIGAQHYDAADRHADSINGLYDPEILTARLIEPFEADADKTRAIFTWVTHNIQYDEAAVSGQKKRGTCADILKRGKAVCHGYARLIERMCFHAGIPCHVVSGFSKDLISGEAGFDAPNHAWNAVRIDTTWYLMDATWQSALRKGTDAFVERYDADYYLTEPGLFILNHLPADPIWQLLDCPITMDEFLLPPDVLLARLDQNRDCSAHRNRLARFLALPEQARKLESQRRAVTFFPSTGNRLELAALLIDCAMLEKDSADSANAANDSDLAMRHYARALDYFREAESLDVPLYRWQKKGYAFTLLNNAVCTYYQTSPTGEIAHLRIIKNDLAQAKRFLQELPDEALPGHSPLDYCNSYLEQVQSVLEERQGKNK